ncbi:Hpt domain-containing protein [Polaromonas sp. JS666]|uniref:Hpt domain-containing protein n=1 Tax=Polaromonas sp. (strain JS666 / ATCC BAA-500) TaxID=296591 RepID=UPI0003074CCA|nr:Hpt domain-containing protein [Polaromonas sp. JS666]
MPHRQLSLELEKLRQLYLSGLPREVELLQDALGQFRQHAGADALMRAHKLTGSGGTFGFPQISAAASSLEQVLTRCQDAGLAPGPEDAGLLDTGLQALQAALAQAGTAAVVSPVSTPAQGAQPSARLIDIIEPDPDVAADLVRQLDQSGYRGRVFDSPSKLAASPAGSAAAILANVGLPEEEQLVLRALARPWRIGGGAADLHGRRYGFPVPAAGHPRGRCRLFPRPAGCTFAARFSGPHYLRRAVQALPRADHRG